MKCSSKMLQPFRFPVLLADIGGTNTRFALLEDAHGELINFESVPTDGFPNLESAIKESVLNHTAFVPETAVIAIAAPVHGDEIPMTNADWVIKPNKLIEKLGLESVLTLNDFEALAMSLLTLEDGDLIKVGGGEIVQNAPKCIIGPGTGLGMASLLHASDYWLPLPGEGGHIELGPVTEEEYQIWKHLPSTDGRIGAEVVLSGSGILRLAESISVLDGVDCNYKSPKDVTCSAKEGNRFALKVLRIFAQVLGRVAGDQALMLLARGGVYVAGGITRIIQDFLVSGEMRAAFENKAPHRSIMQEMPIFLIQNDRPAIRGLASFARTPGRFAVDMEGRTWNSIKNSS